MVKWVIILPVLLGISGYFQLVVSAPVDDANGDGPTTPDAKNSKRAIMTGGGMNYEIHPYKPNKNQNLDPWAQARQNAQTLGHLGGGMYGNNGYVAGYSDGPPPPPPGGYPTAPGSYPQG